VVVVHQDRFQLVVFGDTPWWKLAGLFMNEAAAAVVSDTVMLLSGVLLL